MKIQKLVLCAFLGTTSAGSCEKKQWEDCCKEAKDNKAKCSKANDKVRAGNKGLAACDFRVGEDKKQEWWQRIAGIKAGKYPDRCVYSDPRKINGAWGEIM